MRARRIRRTGRRDGRHRERDVVERGGLARDPEHAQAIALDPAVICETYALESDVAAEGREHRIADLGPFKLLDVSATRDEAGTTVTLGIVNRHRDDAITTSIELGSGTTIKAAVAYDVTGDDPTVRNSFDRPDAVTVQERPLTAGGPSLELTLPAHSVTIVRVEV